MSLPGWAIVYQLSPRQSYFSLLFTLRKQDAIHSPPLRSGIIYGSHLEFCTDLFTLSYLVIHPSTHSLMSAWTHRYLLLGLGYKSSPTLLCCSNCSVANHPRALLFDSDGNCELAKYSSSSSLDVTRWHQVMLDIKSWHSPAITVNACLCWASQVDSTGCWYLLLVSRALWCYQLCFFGLSLETTALPHYSR